MDPLLVDAQHLQLGKSNQLLHFRIVERPVQWNGNAARIHGPQVGNRPFRAVFAGHTYLVPLFQAKGKQIAGETQHLLPRLREGEGLVRRRESAPTGMLWEALGRNIEQFRESRPLSVELRATECLQEPPGMIVVMEFHLGTPHRRADKPRLVTAYQHGENSATGI